MPKLKPIWVKTDIPKRIKIELWRYMIDNPTYRSWEKAIVGKSKTTETDKLLANDELKHLRISRDTYGRLKQEVREMPLEEVAGLPHDLQSWIKQLRPELKSEEGRVFPKGVKWEELYGIAGQLRDSLSRINPKDWAIWELPDTGRPPMTSETGLRIWTDRGRLRVDLALQKDERFPVLMSKLRMASPELGEYDSLKRSLAEFFRLCWDVAQEIWKRSQSETGLMLSPILVAGRGHLLNVPRFVYEFALDNYMAPELPELEVLTNDLHSYKLVPKNLPNYILAIGPEDEMVRCKQVTISLSSEYAKDGRIGDIRDRAIETKSQVEPFLTALSAVLAESTNSG